MAQGFTDDIALLNQGIRKLRPGGGTALFDALDKACRDQMLALREEGAVRRILILVSDGEDNYSRSQQSEAIKMCQRAETIVYAVVFRIIWRSISELFGAVSALRCNASQTGSATTWLQFTSRIKCLPNSPSNLSVLAKERLSFHVGRPDATVRQITLKHYATK